MTPKRIKRERAKVSIMSDLHLEFAPIDLPGGDILILAGDIWTARHMTLPSPQQDRYRRFCHGQLSKYARVLVITGNHEPYASCIDDMDETIRSFLAENAPNAKLLVNETAIIDGTTFLGTPLWATCGVGNPLQERAIGDGMNDFRLIRTSLPAPKYATVRMLGKERLFTPRDANLIHQTAVAWLREELPKHDRCIVIGHHAPSFLSAGGDHQDRDLDAAYCSNLHGLIEAHPQIKVFIHGHTHRSERYKIGVTSVIANPRGYFPDERCSRNFDPSAADFDLEEIV